MKYAENSSANLALRFGSNSGASQRVADESISPERRAEIEKLLDRAMSKDGIARAIVDEAISERRHLRLRGIRTGRAILGAEAEDHIQFVRGYVTVHGPEKKSVYGRYAKSLFWMLPDYRQKPLISRAEALTLN